LSNILRLQFEEYTRKLDPKTQVDLISFSYTRFSKTNIFEIMYIQKMYTEKSILSVYKLQSLNISASSGAKYQNSFRNDITSCYITEFLDYWTEEGPVFIRLIVQIVVETNFGISHKKVKILNTCVTKK
jgi:hypothetical protein